MSKTYEVLVYFHPVTGRDVRVRCDIDKQPGFTRIGETQVHHTEFGSGNERMFTIAYRGPAREAKRFGEMLKLGYDGLGVPRSILSQT